MTLDQFDAATIALDKFRTENADLYLAKAAEARKLAEQVRKAYVNPWQKKRVAELVARLQQVASRLTHYGRERLQVLARRMRLTREFQSVAFVGYTSGVSSRNQNPSAAGGICLLEARIKEDGTPIGRKTNRNGQHEEIGDEFALDAATMVRWIDIASASH